MDDVLLMKLKNFKNSKLLCDAYIKLINYITKQNINLKERDILKIQENLYYFYNKFKESLF